jgi:ABC-type phosphate transport system permease subunit
MFLRLSFIISECVFYLFVFSSVSFGFPLSFRIFFVHVHPSLKHTYFIFIFVSLSCLPFTHFFSQFDFLFFSVFVSFVFSFIFHSIMSAYLSHAGVSHASVNPICMIYHSFFFSVCLSFCLSVYLSV